jgi:hypothetical protein
LSQQFLFRKNKQEPTVKQSTFLKVEEQKRIGNMSRAIEIAAEEELAPIFKQREADEQAKRNAQATFQEMLKVFVDRNPDFDPESGAHWDAIRKHIPDTIDGSYALPGLAQMEVVWPLARVELGLDTVLRRERTGTQQHQAEPTPAAPVIPAEDKASYDLIAKYGGAFGFKAYCEEMPAKQFGQLTGSAVFSRAYDIALAELRTSYSSTPIESQRYGFGEVVPPPAPKTQAGGRVEWGNGGKTEAEAKEIANRQIAARRRRAK